MESSLELGYATTAHRSQGITVDTGHTVVTPGRLTRELLYVSMTRGRHSNTAYVSENDPDEDEILDPSARSSWRVILGEVLAAEGAERTAHEVRDFERQHADSLERLSREYDYLAQIAAGLDLAKAIDGLMPGRSEEMRESPAWGAAVAAWRRASNINRARSPSDLERDSGLRSQCAGPDRRHPRPASQVLLGDAPIAHRSVD